MQTLWLLIPLFFLVVLIVPFLIQVKFSYNIFENIGTFAIRIIFINIKVITFKLSGKNIIIRTKNKAKQVEISLTGPEIKLLEQFFVQIKDKIKIKKLEFHSHIGVSDAFKSAMLSSGISTLVCSLFGHIKNYRPSCAVTIINHTKYDGKVFIVSTYVRASISMFDIIYSLIMASIIVKRSDSSQGYVQVKKG